jgi:hypothetical protein
MTMPHSAGWYDDPDGSGALRYFNGQEWTGQRKRKPPTPSRPPQSEPYAPAPGPPDPYAFAYPYPAGPADPHGAVPPVIPTDPYYGPSDPYGAGGPYGPVPASGAAFPQGPFPPVGPTQQPLLSQLKVGMAVGADRVIGLVTAGVGVALIVASFCPWGHASAPGMLDEGVDGSVSLSFPGLGDPQFALTLSSGGTSVNGKVDSPAMRALHNTNPGWIALALGIVAIVAGVAYLWLRQRLVVAVAAAVLGGIAAVVCLGHLLDVPGTFGDPPGLPNSSFSPGLGLVAAFVLSAILAGVGITAGIIQWRKKFRNLA